MLILAIVLRVLGLWVAISFGLGLCWSAACFVAPHLRRWHDRDVRRASLRRTGFSAADTETAAFLADDLGTPIAPLPRRFAPHVRPLRSNQPLIVSGKSDADDTGWRRTLPLN